MSLPAGVSSGRANLLTLCQESTIRVWRPILGPCFRVFASRRISRGIEHAERLEAFVPLCTRVSVAVGIWDHAFRLARYRALS